MMTELASKTCVPCKGGTPPLKGEELNKLGRQVPEWEVVEEHHLRRRFRFRNFRESLRFINEVGELAEEQGHHPDISLGWGYAEITVWTHKIDGLTESDFIFAAKVDTLQPAA
jgi:4a-hydroxytetrahydrobiopterin dehydratase